MATILFTHIHQLVNVRPESFRLQGKQLAELPCLQDAYLVVEDGRIADYGVMDGLTYQPRDFGQYVDARGRLVLPAWCDSHTHLVFAASREQEFVEKIRGTSYAEIAAKGGGILNSARRLADCSEDTLFQDAWQRLTEIARLGTGAVEIKSGYGLTVESELKMLRVIRRLREKSPVAIRATFLGAHAYPPEYATDHEGYIRLLVEELMPRIAAEKLADFVDVFCEQGFFSPAETVRICEAARTWGMRPKLHVNQLSSQGGIEAGIRVDALSLDHLETMTPQEIGLLAAASSQQNTAGPMATLLPSAAFFLRMPYQPARALLDAGCPVALASDYNPGSSPSGNMNFIVSLACIQLRMLPEEAINAATLNGAYAMGLGEELGSITPGKRANLILTRPVPSLAYLPYSFGTSLVDRVLLGGQWM